METFTEITVKEADIDELEHVNNSVYVSYLQKGREHWYRDAGLSFQEMLARDIGTVVRRLEILYQKELRLGEVIRVRTSPLKLGNTSFTFRQEILNQADEVVSEATVVTVMIDKRIRKSTRVQEEIARHFR